MEITPHRWRGVAVAAVSLSLLGGLTSTRPAAQVQSLPTLTVTGAPQSSGTAAISGIVADAITGRPVAGAIVTLSTIGQSAVTTPRVLTDTRGRFVFRNLPASDSYFLGAQRFGYAYTRYGWTAPDQSRALADISRIALAEGQWRSDVRVPLWRLGAIAGRVVDERGEPVVGAAVRAFTTGRISGNMYLVSGPVATTDDRGVYRLTGLSPGRSAVSVLSVQSTVLSTTAELTQARPVGALDASGVSSGGGSAVSGPTIDVTDRHRLALTNFATPPPPGGGAPRAYQGLFFPGVTDTAQAQFLEIGYGDSRTGIDFQLVPVSAVRVSGRVESPAGAWPQLLRLMPVGSERLGFGSEAATTLIEPDGRFSFLNVPAGRYVILAQGPVTDFSTSGFFPRVPEAPGFPGGGGAGVGAVPGAPGLSYLTRRGQRATLWGRASLDVGDQHIDGFVLALRPTSTVRGRFAFAEGTRPPASNTRIELFLEPATGDPSFGQLIGATALGDATFAFTVEGLLGTSYLLGHVFPFTKGTLSNVIVNYGIVSVMFEGRNLADTGFDAATGGDFDGVVVTLTDKPVEINGRVLGERGPAAATVIAFPVERERWTNFGWSAKGIQSGRSSSAGTYRLRDLSEGEYHVIAVPMTEPTVWMTPEFFAAAAPRSTRLSIKWGETRTVDLKVVEVPRP